MGKDLSDWENKQLTYQNAIIPLEMAIRRAQDDIKQIQILVDIVSKAVDDYNKKRYSLLRNELAKNDGKWDNIAELYGWVCITKRKYDQLCEQKESAK